MSKSIIFTCVLFFSLGLSALDKKTEMYKIILNGDIAICYTGHVIALKGYMKKVEKYKPIVRYNNKCIVGREIFQGDDGNTPYYDDLIEKLNDKMSDNKEKITYYDDKIYKENRRSHPNRSRLQQYRNSKNKYRNENSDIKNEISEIRSEYSRAKSKLLAAQRKAKEIVDVEEKDPVDMLF